MLPLKKIYDKFHIITTVRLLLLIPLVTLISCGKDDNPGPPVPAPTKTQLLTERTWRLTDYTADPAYPVNGNPTTNLFAQLPQCAIDNIYIYTAVNSTDTTGVAKHDEGLTKCQSTQPQTIIGSWSFNPDYSKFRETFNGQTGEANILELTSTTFKVSTQVTENNVTYTMTQTLTAN